MQIKTDLSSHEIASRLSEVFLVFFVGLVFYIRLFSELLEKLFFIGLSKRIVLNVLSIGLLKKI